MTGASTCLRGGRSASRSRSGTDLRPPCCSRSTIHRGSSSPRRLGRLATARASSPSATAQDEHSPPGSAASRRCSTPVTFPPRRAAVHGHFHDPGVLRSELAHLPDRWPRGLSVRNENDAAVRTYAYGEIASVSVTGDSIRLETWSRGVESIAAPSVTHLRAGLSATQRAHLQAQLTSALQRSRGELAPRAELPARAEVLRRGTESLRSWLARVENTAEQVLAHKLGGGYRGPASLGESELWSVSRRRRGRLRAAAAGRILTRVAGRSARPHRRRPEHHRRRGHAPPHPRRPAPRRGRRRARARGDRGRAEPSAPLPRGGRPPSLSSDAPESFRCIGGSRRVRWNRPSTIPRACSEIAISEHAQA